MFIGSIIIVFVVKPNYFIADLINKSNYIKMSDIMKTEKTNCSKIVLFFHICTINDWKNIVKEQMDIIYSSNLYDKLENIFVGCNGTSCDTELSKFFINEPKVSFVALRPNVRTFENETLNALLDYAKECRDKREEAHICYIHSKGVTHTNNMQSYWRKYMMYWNVTRHEVCLSVLNRGYNTIGTQFLSVPKKHYSGNFFWTTSSYASRLDGIRHTENRYNAEHLILSSAVPQKHVAIERSWFYWNRIVDLSDSYFSVSSKSKETPLLQLI